MRESRPEFSENPEGDRRSERPVPAPGEAGGDEDDADRTANSGNREGSHQRDHEVSEGRAQTPYTWSSRSAPFAQFRQGRLAGLLGRSGPCGPSALGPLAIRGGPRPWRAMSTSEIERIRTMWQIVLILTVIDEGPEAAIKWARSPWGRMVCEFAGINPAWVERKLRGKTRAHMPRALNDLKPAATPAAEKQRRYRERKRKELT